jgi:hypothetical protein
MAFTSFIPQIWNAQMLLDYRESVVAGNLVNRNYEGDARSGNTVKINTASAVAIKDYKAASRTTSADAISSTSIDLLIDQEKNFDFYVDDIDRAQAAGTLDAYSVSAAQGMAEDADKFILALASGAKAHQTATTITTGDAALNVLRDLHKAMNKNKVPMGQRVAVVNAEFEALLLEAASKITNVDKSGSPAGLREASLGRLLNFDIVRSENLPVTAKPQVVAWYQPAVAFVSQVTETEALRATDKFADRIRGLHVYGGKVVKTAGVEAWTSI